jgi:hypothetical protein
MNVILFSKEQSILDHWKNILNDVKSSRYKNIIACNSFKELGDAITDEEHILMYHLATGDEEEKICYQFVSKYQQQHKMLVFVNAPNANQGLRIFRSGIHGYSNTYLAANKLLIACYIIEQGKIWVGSETLNKLLNDCGFRATQPVNKLMNDNKQKLNTATKDDDKSFIGVLFKGMKNLFG